MANDIIKPDPVVIGIDFNTTPDNYFVYYIMCDSFRQSEGLLREDVIEGEVISRRIISNE